MPRVSFLRVNSLTLITFDADMDKIFAIAKFVPRITLSKSATELGKAWNVLHPMYIFVDSNLFRI